MIDKKFKIKPIPDSEINLSENDILGTSVYVETIKQIIENPETPTPLTIALFGSWGSGKSSIIKTLEEIYKKETKNIKFFVYDAWKYSKDDFRRTFILDLRKNFGLTTKEEEELFYRDKSEEIRFKPRLDIWTVIIFIFSLLLTFLTSYFLKLASVLNNILGALSFSTLLSVLFSFFRSALIYHKIAITTSKLFAPEQFENRFRNTINEIIKNGEKLVIAIDNIDRCHKEQAFEILLTVKTFLGHKNVIFIIPVDDKGFKSYLQMSNRDADEFLRKLFNVSTTIRSFSSSELYDFGLKLCEKYEIDFPKKETVISLICQEFSRNPRRIIQFLNNLQVEYNLAIEQEKGGFIPSGSITNNIEMLVKLLIIREEYPELYEKMKDNKSLLQTITDDLKAGRFNKNGELWDNGNIKLTEEEYRFLMRTANIVLDEARLEPFFIVKDIFKDVPDKIEELVLSQDWKSIKEYIDKGQVTFDKLIYFIETKIDEDVIKRKLYDTSGFNLLSLLLKIIVDKGDENFALRDKIISFLNIKHLWKNPSNYPIKELALSLRWLKTKGIDEPINYVIEAMNNTKNLTDKNLIILLKEFINVFKKDETILSKIKDKFSEILLKDFTLYNDFKDIIESESIKYLLDNNFVKQIIPTLSQDFNQNLTKEKIKIIKALNKHEVLDDDNIIQYINRCIQYAGILQNYNNWIIFGFWLEALVGFVNKLKNNNTLSNLYSFLSQNYNFLITNYNNGYFGEDQIKVYKAYINVLGEFYLSTDHSNYRQNISSWLNAFSNPINLDVFSQVYKVYRKIISETQDWQTLIQFIINQLINQNNWDYKKVIIETVNLTLTKTNENKGLNQAQINQVLSHYFDLFIKGNEEIEKYILEISQSEFIGNKVIDYLLDLPSNYLEKVLSILESLIDKYGFERFYPKIKELLASSNPREQEMGIELLHILKEKIPNDKKETIKHLLSDIDLEKITDEARQKLKAIEKYLQSNTG
ncbi:KAP family P-loop NTPase fold protein [Candidatus Chrysopegis kryptomonas]|uniref:KAP family P-loop domain-containing protein n=1 Tax=Candidatus Chryseopegocella kryptomonas TaxID=1633643 RepID=A0A0N7MVR9_9BACT|nr:P-loop NTPase fold protein [Candidatus Chrysopegis kryptomonas]CUS96611.1 KAP family P-loop domain-containing protein [Candidatus Chrysopegis kryptomonas]